MRLPHSLIPKPGKYGSMAANQSSGGTPPRSTPPDATPGQPAAANRKRGRKPGDGTVQTFRSPTAAVIWVVWLLFAVANWIDLAVQGRDHLSVVAAALLLLVTGIAYVTAQRPRIIADETGVTVRNPLRDHRIGWAAVTKVDLADLLRVHTAAQGQRPKVISSWAVHYSRRRQFAAESRARRASRPGRSSFGLLSGGRGLSYGHVAPAPAAGTPEAEAEKVARLLSERATAAQAETVWAKGTEEKELTAPAEAAVTGWLEPLKSTWSRTAIVAVLVPALILLVVCLV